MKSLAFYPSPNAVSSVLASAGDYTVLLSDLSPYQKASIFSISPHSLGKEVEAVAISPDGSILVSGGRDGLVVLMTLSLPSLFPDRDNTISSRLRNYRVVLSQIFDSTEDLAEEMSQISASEGDPMTGSSSEDLLLETDEVQKRYHDSKQIQFYNRERIHRKNEATARESRKNRTEKKPVDLPTMIAHLSSIRSSLVKEQLSSSDSEEDVISELQDQQKKLNSLIDVAQKVSKYSQITEKTSVQDKVPKPRYSLLPMETPDVIRDHRKFFEDRQNYDGTDGDGDNSDSESSQSGHYYMKPLTSLDCSLETKDFITTSTGTEQALLDSNCFPSLASSQEQSFGKELGSGDESDDIPLSVI